ncbi:UDP-N-acetylglucosamine 2-epimerase (non-hydrolyzing) [Salinarchaeum sp. IM2453]|uniref:non-hydrolyzing UDP-N-acetylglucosamine 2-epimerase n=1 Tax=Salinarchaeum sp. IM2453 TaxID=2862870 RepID=UPI001C83608B|nr:UDP-N-acetylglucosamine 2-epimerase (non-hydrolyzing) [Salinarchaeum sp. IM2453]QZA89070.1 UDP-N-acetylglucosamine 2-epimerase (non-hydrolyzing) [Salinarchaeum sp. IM2453]
MTNQTIAFVLGTRPEIIKCAPVIRECDRRNVPYEIIHTGQHYSDELDRVFFEQLQLPVPECNLEIGSGTHGKQTGEMIVEIEKALTDGDPDVLLVQGDTNSVLAGGIAASKLSEVAVGHIEAGLRSYDRNMPEETNRRVVDHVSDYLFAPTDDAQQNLLEEDIPKARIEVTGNTIVDAVRQNVGIAREQSDILEQLNLDSEFALLTAHRAENVDTKDRFTALLEGVSQVSKECGFDVVYPIHPRAEKRMNEFDIEVPSEVHLIEPLDFLDFLLLEDQATIVLTDSGGVQEETCILQTPCVTLRDNTERPETVAVGANRVVGVQPDQIRNGVTKMLEEPTDWKNPFGDGTAAEQIVSTVINDER